MQLLERVAEAAHVMLNSRAEDERQAAEAALEDALVALYDAEAS